MWIILLLVFTMCFAIKQCQSWNINEARKYLYKMHIYMYTHTVYICQVHIAYWTAKHLSAWASQEQRPCYEPLLSIFFPPHTKAIVPSSPSTLLPFFWPFTLSASALLWLAMKQKERKIKRRVINKKMTAPAPQRYPYKVTLWGHQCSRTYQRQG